MSSQSNNKTEEVSYVESTDYPVQTLYRNIGFLAVGVGIILVMSAGTLFPNVPSSNQGTNQAANVYVIGAYAWTLLGLLFLAARFWSKCLINFTTTSGNKKRDVGTIFAELKKSVLSLVSCLGGLTIMCLMIIYAIGIRCGFADYFRIGRVSKDFLNLESIFNWVFTFALYFLYKVFSLVTNKGKDDPKTTMNNLVLILFGYIGTIVLVIMNVNMAFFTTEGFKN